MELENGDRYLVCLVIIRVVNAFWLNQDEEGISGQIGEDQHDLRGHNPVEGPKGSMGNRQIKSQRALEMTAIRARML